MKKLILINIVLFILLRTLPEVRQEIIEEPILLDNIIEDNVIETIDNVEENIDITSRSMIETRQTEYIKPTTYSDKLLEFIQQKEGFHSTAYKNSGEKYWTIGYGHYGADVYDGQEMTKETAERLLIAELDGACNYVLQYCDYLELNQNQLDALTSFTFNGGPGMLQKLTNHKKRNLEEISEHITAYTNGGIKGLIIRRQQEKEMFLKEVD